MTFVLDESVGREIAERLRADGHRVIHISETKPGISDETVLETAVHHKAVLITLDKDFGELVFRSGRPHPGVVLVRLPGAAPAHRAAVVASLIFERGEELPGSFTVVSPLKIRIRRMGG
ncbi:MAG: DUF5615 family PIN-like protein [Gemmatimonadetes bacterium]|nr:DUF5615 family PIN-like protein [Gemmatimonadota bacterium]